jgi:hypothetical protein
VHPITLFARYLPRAARSGVCSNFCSVSGRERGPKNGHQPIVEVIATTKMTARVSKARLSHFPNFLIQTRPLDCAGFYDGDDPWLKPFIVELVESKRWQALHN